MKLSTKSVVLLFVAAIGVSTLLCCKKKPFVSGTGLYSVKQYHVYQINSLTDSTKMADEHISILAMDNSNYLSWNNIKFHLWANQGDTIKTFINDSLIDGGYRILYRLQYLSQSDNVSVINEARDKVWVSF